jgi:hypothetical protein
LIRLCAGGSSRPGSGCGKAWSQATRYLSGRATWLADASSRPANRLRRVRSAPPSSASLLPKAIRRPRRRRPISQRHHCQNELDLPPLRSLPLGSVGPCRSMSATLRGHSIIELAQRPIDFVRLSAERAQNSADDVWHVARRQLRVARQAHGLEKDAEDKVKPDFHREGSQTAVA